MHPDSLDFTPLLARLGLYLQQDQLYEIESAVATAADERHGRSAEWAAAIDQLPDVTPTSVDLAQAVRVGRPTDLSPTQQRQLEAALQALHPWRKGPFELFGLHIDTEWRSDWKWARVQPALQPLAGRKVLDVGCGSGYHLWRMAGEGARLAVGLEPMWLYLYQFAALQRYLRRPEVGILPLRLDQLPAEPGCFDTVFSMGVLYHARSPFDHLFQLREALRPGGQLILETLVIHGGPHEVLVPEGRYAQMRNVWFLPSPLLLESWLRKCGFTEVELVDLNETSLTEQRSTPWMRFHSLVNYLDPADPSRTVEGYPRPLRAVFAATMK